MRELVKQYVRPLVYAHRRRRARRLAARPGPLDDARRVDIAYIVACGRSGTTILGKILQQHPDVCYLFEPYHLWAAVLPETDATNLYERVEGRMILDGDSADDAVRLRFRRAIGDAARRAGRRHLIEKTPHNAMRIGFLEALSDDPRYVHIVRDGVAVARSIARVAGDNTYAIATRPGLNQWWGEDDIKWRTLCADARRRGYFPDEIEDLRTDLQRGAFEWLVTMLEIERYRARLGDRMLDIRYDDLRSDPRQTLTRIAEFVGFGPIPSWLDAGEAMIGSPRTHPPDSLELPPTIADAFNECQVRLGFDGRARALGEPIS